MAGFNQYKVGFTILLASTGESPKFCQIYFINNEESQVATMCVIIDGLKPDIVNSINRHWFIATIMLKFYYVASIKVVINEAKRPVSQHSKRYDSPLSDEAVVLMPNNNVNNRDTMLHYRDGGL